MSNVVAIGDVHGCYSLLIETLQPLLGTQAEVVFLGDLIDRSPEPAGDIQVLNLVHGLQENPEEAGLSKVTVLTGNHEQLFLQAVETGDTELWEWNGGNVALIQQAEDHIEWLQTLPFTYVKDNYLFVHAGVRPNVPLEEQTKEDCTWIRDPFLNVEDHGLPYTVVHGHTIVPNPEIHPHRINIDTGAFHTGKLTALNITLPR